MSRGRGRVDEVETLALHVVQRGNAVALLREDDADVVGEDVRAVHGWVGACAHAGHEGLGIRFFDGEDVGEWADGHSIDALGAHRFDDGAVAGAGEDLDFDAERFFEEKAHRFSAAEGLFRIVAAEEADLELLGPASLRVGGGGGSDSVGGASGGAGVVVVIPATGCSEQHGGDEQDRKQREFEQFAVHG